MLKFAFIVNMPGLAPENFRGVYENAESHNEIIGVDSMDAASALVEQLSGEGFTLYNLCSAFSADDRTVLHALAGPETRMAAASYSEAEGAKVDALEDFSSYGIIVQMVGVDEPHVLKVEGPDFKAEAIFVKNMEAAKAAAGKLVEDGVTFIELCSWFKGDMVDDIVKAIDGAVPVGSAGL